MTGPARSIWRSVRDLWSAVTGRDRGRLPNGGLRGVYLHDPDAHKPKDLDDPFHDNKVQERLAEVIARAAGPSEKDRPHRD